MANKLKVVIEGENLSRPALEQMEQDLHKAQERIEAISHAFEAFISAEVVAKFTEITKAAIETDTAIAHLSQKVGMNVEFLGGLSYAAQLSEVSMDELGVGLKKFDQAITQAGQGEKKASDAFAALGINVKNANGTLRPTEDLLMDVANAFHGSEDGATKTAIAVALFGRSGASLIPLLNQGSSAIDKMRAKADRLGGVMSGETAEAAEKLHGMMVDLKTVSMGLANQFLEGLKPAIDEIANSMDQANMKGDSWMKSMGQGFAALTTELPMEIRMKLLRVEISLDQEQMTGGPLTIKASGGHRDQVALRLQQDKAELADLERRYAAFMNKMNGTEMPLPMIQRSSHGLNLWGEGTAEPPKKVLALPESDTEKDKTKQLEDAKARLREAGAEVQMNIAKGLEKAEIAQLELEKEKGLITLQEYYTRRAKIQSDAADAELQAMMNKENALIAKRDAFKEGTPEYINADAEVVKAEGEIWVKVQEIGAQELKNATDEEKRRTELKNFLIASEADLRSAKGQTLQVALAAIQQEYDAKRQKAVSLGASATDIRGIDQAQQLKQTQLLAQDVEHQIEDVYARLEVRLAQIRVAVNNYSMDAITAERQTNAARAQAAQSVADLTKQYRTLAMAAGDPKMITNSDKLAVKLTELQMRSHMLADTVKNGLESSFTSFFSTLTRTGSASKAFEAFANSMISAIEALIAKLLVLYMWEQMVGMFAGGAVGGAGSGATISTGDMLYGGYGAPVPMLAGGGSLAANQPAIVGEAGPELWVPDSSGTVVPNSVLSGGGGGAPKVNLTVVNHGTQKSAQVSQPQWDEQARAWHMQLHMDDMQTNGPISRGMAGS